MLKYYVKASDLLERLRTDKDGVVSFEYIIVAACIVAAVAAAFGTGAGGAIGTALTAGINNVIGQIPGAADPRGGHRDAPPPLSRHASDELDWSHSLGSANPVVALRRRDRYRDTIDPQ